MDFRNGFPIGYVSKSHGFKGHVKLNFFKEEYKNNIKKSGYLFLEISKKGVPFFIEELDSSKTIVKLEDVNSEDEAKKLSAMQVVTFDDSVKELQFQLMDFTLVDQHGKEVGLINDLVDLQGNVLLEVRRGVEEIYIPFHEDLIHEINPESKRVVLEIAEGLLDI